MKTLSFIKFLKLHILLVQNITTNKMQTKRPLMSKFLSGRNKSKIRLFRALLNKYRDCFVPRNDAIYFPVIARDFRPKQSIKLYKINTALLILLSLFTISCRRNKLDVNLSSIQIPHVEINRLEKDLFEMNPDSIEQKTPEMLEKYGNFYARFVTNIINDGGVRDSSYNYNLKQFITDHDMRETYTDCKKNYPDLSHLEEDLTEAFKHFRYYFPDRNIPQVTTFMSGFNYSIVNIDSVLGIGLEMYLGQDNKFYTMLQFPNYKTMRMSKEYILPDCIRGWMSTEFEMNELKNDFLSRIIHEGKVMYLVDAMLPSVHDSLKIGYSNKQLEWCQRNEFNMWAYFIQNKILYSVDDSEILKYTAEGPFTAAINREAPSRVGYWIGWQIVRAYMNNNPETTLQQLMNERDAQKVLTKAKYKPEK